MSRSRRGRRSADNAPPLHVAAPGRQRPRSSRSASTPKFVAGQERLQEIGLLSSASLGTVRQPVETGRAGRLRRIRPCRRTAPAAVLHQPGVGSVVEPETPQLHPHDRRHGHHLDFVGGRLLGRARHNLVETCASRQQRRGRRIRSGRASGVLRTNRWSGWSCRAQRRDRSCAASARLI